MVHKPDGIRERISGSAPTHINTKVAAERAILDHIERPLHPDRVPTRKETPTFSEWFKGRFWKEWVIGRKNKPTEVRSKEIIYKNHLEPRFGDMPLDEIRRPRSRSSEQTSSRRSSARSASTTSSPCCRSR